MTGVPAALQMIQTIRRDAVWQARVRALGSSPSLDALVALGAAHGLSFTKDDLRVAFRHDWNMRWHGYQLSQASR